MAKTVFESRYVTLTLTMKAPRQVKVGDAVIFEPGHLIRFENGQFATDDPEEIEFIKSHRFFGSQIVEAVPAPTTDGKKVSAFACGYPGCNYVAVADSEIEAIRKLNGHKTKKGHWLQPPAEPPQVEGSSEPEEPEESD